MSTASELRDLTLDELRQKEHELDDQLFRMRLQKAMGHLETPVKLPAIKKSPKRRLSEG